jgi:hypothetical protein
VAAVPRALWEGRAICDGYPARSGTQLKRYGTNIAKWDVAKEHTRQLLRDELHDKLWTTA